MADTLTRDVKKDILKEIIKRLHNGEPLADIKKAFKMVLSHVTTTEIAELEEELIKEGMKREELLRLCDIHTELFKEAIESEQTLAPIGHPIYILMKEHRLMLDLTENLKRACDNLLETGTAFESMLKRLSELIDNLKSTEYHYLREENVLFPYLEKHGVTEPPKIMWMEHDKIREIKKLIYAQFEDVKKIFMMEKLNILKNYLNQLYELISSHFYKENNILFNAAMRLINDDEWFQIYKEFVEIGFTNFYTPELWKEAVLSTNTSKVIETSEITFNTGYFSVAELDAMLNTLPVDITFVDSNDKVRYFSDTKERIFVRTKAIIGRTVQQCHPSKSIHIVNKILENFKTGKRDKESFWINLQDKIILIQYFAVRDKRGSYLGCVEVTTDITDIKKIEGEKRLLEE